ncbi:outer envelope pore protein 21, chloroplastic-like [Coffea eugenioides]|uniref:Outer envelope pore protein 21, chloroplastic-like n=1 Tax=Coffea arabica TaxID=13443 RepID=A0ABM4VYC3_COFAR|nr:outer envelope pore protein 21, chloroplastic-like [Coffea arabica]XP_027147965.1 outer envelope pore protein 21, chloroplastic-like [Coffea eugenioides]
METSIRYGGDSKALRIHAKEKLPIDSNTHLQLHGELDTRLGAPTCLTALIRHFYPSLSADLGVGLKYNRQDKLHYTVRAKKAFPVTTNGFFNFHVKGHCDVDQEFRQKRSRGAAEFSWIIFNLKTDQDVKLKVGYEVFDKVPYMQIRENNWTINADMNGRWNLRYDL